MEDAHAAVLDLDEQPDKSNSFFAVYDGHGGMFPCSLFSRPIIDPYSRLNRRQICRKACTPAPFERGALPSGGLREGPSAGFLGDR